MKERHHADPVVRLIEEGGVRESKLQVLEVRFHRGQMINVEPLTYLDAMHLRNRLNHALATLDALKMQDR